MATTATRLGTFILPAIYLTQQPGFEMRQVGYLAVVTVVLQALVSGLLVRSQLRRRLAGLRQPARMSTAPV